MLLGEDPIHDQVVSNYFSNRMASDHAQYNV